MGERGGAEEERDQGNVCGQKTDVREGEVGPDALRTRGEFLDETGRGPSERCERSPNPPGRDK